MLELGLSGLTLVANAFGIQEYARNRRRSRIHAAEPMTTSDSTPEFFRAVFDSLDGEVAVLDRHGLVLAVSHAWTVFAGCNGGEASATGVGAQYLNECDRAVARGDLQAGRCAAGIRAVLSGSLPQFVMDYVCAEKWFQLVSSPLRHSGGGAVISHIDIGRRRLAELEANRLLIELSHVERLTLLGRFTASLAHELYQPLTAISANAETGELLVDSGSQNAAELQKIFSGITSDAIRAGNVISRLRVLLRKGAPEFLSTDLNRLIQETIELARLHSSMPHVQISLRLASGLPAVTVDSVQIQQVLLNLIYNSAEAMQAVGLEDRRLLLQTSARDGSNVTVSVTDSGPGITAKQAEQIFEAFVTTKPEGMGMGLHVSRSIIRAHGGRIWASPRRGRGGKFCFSLPLQAVGADDVEVLAEDI